ncbi:endonuclease domain-containing 1 protein-like [Salvelinus alpinus]
MCWVERFDPECKKFFLEGTTPNLPGILYDGTVQDQNRYKPICQKFNNIYRFATLYDTTNRIPVFSAYTFTGSSKEGRPKLPCMIEPELNRYNNNHEMQVDHSYQAGNYDYKNSIQNKGVNKGFLFPNSHAHDLDTQTSTFTLTNIVPQVVSFNDGSWKKMEDYVRTKFKEYCISNNLIKAYVVTGAVPSESNTLNNRVNIPDLMWTAFCCYNSEKKEWMAGAHWESNKKEDKGKTMITKTLGALEKMLKKGGRAKVFPKDCPRDTKPTTSQ